MEEISEERFRRIVLETCREVIAIRAEPTPYTILINQVDPVLAKRGLFGTLQTGLDVKTVLEESIGKEFELVEAKLGARWANCGGLRTKHLPRGLEAIPLTERVEETSFVACMTKAASPSRKYGTRSRGNFPTRSHPTAPASLRPWKSLAARPAGRLDVEGRNPLELVAPQRADRAAGEDWRSARTFHLDWPAGTTRDGERGC